VQDVSSEFFINLPPLTQIRTHTHTHTPQGATYITSTRIRRGRCREAEGERRGGDQVERGNLHRYQMFSDILHVLVRLKIK